MIKREKLKKRIYAVSACLAGAMLVTGCGDVTRLGASVNSKDAGGNNKIENTAGQMQYITDDSTAEDYQTLADRYAELGMIRRQRDILEQSYRLFGAEETLEKLCKIYVNLDEEDTEIQDMAELMLQNMELEEYRPESLHLVEEDDWFTTLMPKLYEGKRNYFRLADGEVKMVVSVGYDENGQFSDIWYYGEDNKIIYLGYDNNTARMMDTTTANGAYEGEFILWTLDGITGNIMKETGSFSEGVLQTDNYTIELHEGFGESDIYDLWNNRENMEYTALDGYGGAPGKSKLSEIPANPVFTVYEPVDEEAVLNSGNPQIRVFDGEIQWLSDNGWISLGTFSEYAQNDPFLEYAAAKKEFDEGIKSAQTVQSTPEPTIEPTATPAPEVTATPDAAATPKATATPKPAATPKPTATPKPAATPKPTPTPQPPADDDDDDDSGSDDGGSDNNGGDNGGSSDSGNGGGSDSGGDVDIEWTDDIL